MEFFEQLSASDEQLSNWYNRYQPRFHATLAAFITREGFSLAIQSVQSDDMNGKRRNSELENYGECCSALPFGWLVGRWFVVRSGWNKGFWSGQIKGNIGSPVMNNSFYAQPSTFDHIVPMASQSRRIDRQGRLKRRRSLLGRGENNFDKMNSKRNSSMPH